MYMAPELNEGQARRKGAVDRIAVHSKGLLDDIKDYLELRVTRFALEVREDQQVQRRTYIRYVAIGILGVLAAMFLLLAGAVYLGSILGDVVWGFLVTGSAAALAAGILFGTRPDRRSGNTRRDGKNTA